MHAKLIIIDLVFYLPTEYPFKYKNKPLEYKQAFLWSIILFNLI